MKQQLPPGFRLVWGTIGAGALALLLYGAEHHAVPSAPRAGGRAGPIAPSTSPSDRTASSSALADAPSRAPVGIVPVADSGRPGAAPSSSTGASSASSLPAGPTTAPPSTSPSSPTSPTPTPSPSQPVPLLAASAVVAIPIRGSAGLEVRLGLVASTAPPFPLLPGVSLSVGLP